MEPTRETDAEVETGYKSCVCCCDFFLAMLFIHMIMTVTIMGLGWKDSDDTDLKAKIIFILVTDVVTLVLNLIKSLYPEFHKKTYIGFIDPLMVFISFCLAINVIGNKNSTGSFSDLYNIVTSFFIICIVGLLKLCLACIFMVYRRL